MKSKAFLKKTLRCILIDLGEKIFFICFLIKKNFKMHHLPLRRALLCILLSSIPVVQNSIQPFCDGSLPSSLT